MVGQREGGTWTEMREPGSRRVIEVLMQPRGQENAVVLAREALTARWQTRRNHHLVAKEGWEPKYREHWRAWRGDGEVGESEDEAKVG